MRMEFVGTPSPDSIFPYKPEGWYRGSEKLGEVAELLEDRSIGLKGLKKITSVVGNIITIDLSDVPDVPDQSAIISSVLTNIRISTASSIPRAQEIYTSLEDKQGYYAFVIINDRDAIQSDRDKDEFKSKPSSDLKKLNVRQLFTIFLLAPVTTVSSSQVKNIIYTELFEVFLSCLHGWNECGYIGDGQVVDSTALYGHGFDYESRMILTYDDGYKNEDTVAFRQIEAQQIVNEQGEMNAEINL